MSEKITLYQFPGGAGVLSVSPPCVRVQLALRRMDLEYDVVDLMSRGRARKVSPTGRLPALRAGDQVVSESVSIIDFLEERHPDRRITPSEAVERVADRLWEHYVNDTLYWYGFYMRWVVRENRERLLAALTGKGIGAALRRLVMKAFFVGKSLERAHAHGIGGLPEEQVRRLLERAMLTIQDGLAGGPYLGGRGEPGRGDLAVASTLINAGFRNSSPELMDRLRAAPALIDHTKRTLEACRTEVPRWFS